MNLFKKSLLATALTAISAGAMAVNVTSTKLQHTDEGIKTAAVVEGADFVATLQAEYKADDIIKFSTSLPLDATFIPKPTINADVSGAVGITAMTLGYMSQASNAMGGTDLVYRVTTLTTSATPNSTIGSTVTLGDLANLEPLLFDADAVRASKNVNVTYAAETSNGIVIDTPTGANTATASVLSVAGQYTVVVDTEFNGVINVEKDRKEFVTPQNTNMNDDAIILSFTDTTAGGSNDKVATAGLVDATIYGNFSFLDTDDTQDGIQLGANTVVASLGTGSIAPADITASSIIVKGIDASAKQTVTIDVKEDVVIPAQDFTVDYKLTYTDADSNAQTVNAAGLTAGSWELNGSSTDITYVPYGSNLEQFIWVTNKGSQSGAISVSAFDEAGNEYGPYDLGTSESGTIKRLSADIAEKLAEDGFTTGRVSMNVTVNVPKADATVYAAYKVVSDADRLTLPTNKL
jgi:hypothetical protein